MIRRASLLSTTCFALFACQDPGGGVTETETASDTSTTTSTGGPTTDAQTTDPPTTDTSTTGTTDATTTSTSTSTSTTVDTTTTDATTTEGVDTTTTTTTSTTTETTTTEGVDTTTTSTTSTSTTSTSTGDTDTETTGEPSPWDGEPLPDAPPGEWQWVPFPESLCRDGSTTGIAVRYGTAPGLMIYFQSGGACFNAATCNQNIKTFGVGSYNNFVQNVGSKGIFDPDEPANPVLDWSAVFVPYCSGDVHAGARNDVVIPGLADPQQFVGYHNVTAYLERIVPTFVDSVDHVLVTGESAGGFGSAFNYDRIAEAFPDRAVTLIDDSGPVMSDEFMAPCLQQQWRDLWNFEDTLPADCGECFNPDGGGISNVIKYLGEKYADQRLGLISALQDQTIRYFFGFGLNECAGGQMSGATFTEGLADLRDDWMSEPAGTWGTFYPSGAQHTWLTQNFYTAEIDGTLMRDWVADLLAGTATHVAP
ncbi:pectin acetylesterase-family hydrolase [Nannocystis sp. ILAH1]|uniref:pectin acetylesterase-family hydrolase n=1 Tax=unclassified Nannocystis TaxID=2627009 RepID=UPI0022704799|nr:MULTISPECIES: pectin acetylesterase-family hydrolase [unclassified Nannocystis]MCY0992696.1 pectin acetylesterase-family hydrolase [Nannocystis sp. ILAH1]MCY1070075.1 pectin acetylesterase-family hydrolase [Nannocystis sp. RBIL2]